MSDRAVLAEVFHLENDTHFELLSDSTRLEIIEMLYTPHSVGELADALGVPRTRLYHHVNLLEEHGMIRVVDSRRSGAVDEKLYQVTARSFQPSPEYLKEAVPRDRAKALIASIFGSTQADFVRAVDEGTASLEDDRASRSIHVHRGLAFLDKDRLHAFVTELESLYDRYHSDIDDPEELPDDAIPVAVVSLVYPTSRHIR